MIDRKLTQKFWDGRAAMADDPRAVTLERESAERVAREVALYQQWLFRRLDAAGASTARVADLGCGNGDWTVALARRAQRLFATDFTEGFLAHTGRRLRAVAPACEAELVRADLAEVELPGRFDLIVCGAVVQYLDDAEVEALLARIAAALGDGGRLYFRTTVARRADRRERDDGRYSAVYRAIPWYRERLLAAGFCIDEDAVATDYVAEEWAQTSAPPALRRPAAALGKLVRRSYRALRPTDVYVCLARRAA